MVLVAIVAGRQEGTWQHATLLKDALVAVLTTEKKNIRHRSRVLLTFTGYREDLVA